MSTVQSTGGFAADAVRYATDVTGNGSYYIPDGGDAGENLYIGGTLTVGGTATFEGNVNVGSTAEPSNYVNYGTTSATNFQGTNPVDGYRSIFPQGLAANGVTIGGSGGSTLLLGDAAVPGGNIIGYNGSATVSAVNFGNGLNSAADVNVTGNVAATASLICGSTASPGGQIKGYNGTAFVPPIFPLGMLGGQNATPYLLAQPTNGTPLQGAAVTWNGSPINIQLNGSALSNAQTFYNIIIPTAFQATVNSGKLLYFGQIVMGGSSGATGGVIVNVYNNVVSVGTLISQFGMDPSLTGGAIRVFQGIYEFGNPDYTPYGSISRFSYAGIESQ
jgi:hypothetical protein